MNFQNFLFGSAAALAAGLTVAAPAPAEAFERGQLAGYPVAVVDNGQYGTDIIVVDGPRGNISIGINCNVTQDYAWIGTTQADRYVADQVAKAWCGW